MKIKVSILKNQTDGQPQNIYNEIQLQEYYQCYYLHSIISLLNSKINKLILS